MNATNALGAVAIVMVASACDRTESAPAPVTTVALAPVSAQRVVPIAPKPTTTTFEQKVSASKPLAPTPAPVQLPGKKIEAELCKLEGREFVGKSTLDVFKAVEASGNRLLVVEHQGAIVGFSIDTKQGCTLTLDASFGVGGTLKLPEKVENLSRDGSGRVFASNGIFGGHALKDGNAAFKCDTKGHIEVHASGKWAIAPWVNANVRLVEIEGEACKSEDWVLTDLNDEEKRKGPFANVNSAAIVGDRIVMGGVLSKQEDPKQARAVIAFDKAGKEKLRFGNADASAKDGFGWVHAIEPCKAGICVLDSNQKRLSLWTRAGKHVGNVDLSQLLGLANPASPDFTVAKDGSAWIVAAQARDGSTVAEGLVYRVRGL